MEASLSSSVSGMRVSITRHDVTAHDVANVNTPGYEERRVNQAAQTPSGVAITSITSTPNSPSAESNTDLVEETKEQIVNKHANSANAKALKVKDRMLGELLDITG